MKEGENERGRGERRGEGERRKETREGEERGDERGRGKAESVRLEKDEIYIHTCV